MTTAVADPPATPTDQTPTETPPTDPWELIQQITDDPADDGALR